MPQFDRGQRRLGLRAPATVASHQPPSEDSPNWSSLPWEHFADRVPFVGNHGKRDMNAS